MKSLFLALLLMTILSSSLTAKDNFEFKKENKILMKNDKIVEKLIEKVNNNTFIIDLEEIKIVGVKIHFSAESRGALTDFGTNAVRTVGQKYIKNGTVKIISDLLKIENPQIIGARVNVEGDGVFYFVIGVIVENFDNIPDYLPEYTVKITCPAKRYTRMDINETKNPMKSGYDGQMQADEYFIGDFRKDTKYIYDKTGVAFNTFDEYGEFQAKYEPIKIPKTESEKFDSIVMRVVTLPDILCSCSMTGPDDEEFVIFKYFNIQDQIFPLDSAKMYNDDYYGFPYEKNDITYACFGSRVSSFDGLPDIVEKITIKGGIYLHISQLEFNGDNPSIPYDIAFNHIDKLFLKDNPDYDRDFTKHVIARFRQANCASVFVPLILKSVK